jgi:hypothetical protein
MLRIKTLVLLALTSSAALVNAQTGPSTPINPSSNPAPVQSNILNADRVANYLRSQGHTVEQKRFDNGVHLVSAKIQKDGWRFEMEIQFTPDQKTLNFVVPLGQATSNFSAAQLQALMKANFTMSPTAFSYREWDRRLCLIDPIWNTVNWTETAFQQTLDRVLKQVKDTHHVWDSSRWPTNGTPTASTPTNSTPTSSVPPVAPVTNTPPSAPAVAQGLGDASYVGSETLGSYGRLEFKFSGANNVVMIDKDGQAPGTYTMQGSTVTIRFTYSNGAVVAYTGTLNGSTIAGTATNGKDNWNFTVSK